jgi:hypothetical protein
MSDQCKSISSNLPNPIHLQDLMDNNYYNRNVMEYIRCLSSRFKNNILEDDFKNIITKRTGEGINLYNEFKNAIHGFNSLRETIPNYIYVFDYVDCENSQTCKSINVEENLKGKPFINFLTSYEPNMAKVELSAIGIILDFSNSIKYYDDDITNYVLILLALALSISFAFQKGLIHNDLRVDDVFLRNLPFKKENIWIPYQYENKPLYILSDNIPTIMNFDKSSSGSKDESKAILDIARVSFKSSHKLFNIVKKRYAEKNKIELNNDKYGRGDFINYLLVYYSEYPQLKAVLKILKFYGQYEISNYSDTINQYHKFIVRYHALAEILNVNIDDDPYQEDGKSFYIYLSDEQQKSEDDNYTNSKTLFRKGQTDFFQAAPKVYGVDQIKKELIKHFKNLTLSKVLKFHYNLCDKVYANEKIDKTTEKKIQRVTTKIPKDNILNCNNFQCLTSEEIVTELNYESININREDENSEDEGDENQPLLEDPLVNNNPSPRNKVSLDSQLKSQKPNELNKSLALANSYLKLLNQNQVISNDEHQEGMNNIVTYLQKIKFEITIILNEKSKSNSNTDILNMLKRNYNTIVSIVNKNKIVLKNANENSYNELNDKIIDVGAYINKINME